MRSLFYKLYFLLTGPLYRRLHRELSMQLQEVVRANIEHHENTSKKILDELLRLSFIVDGSGGAVPGPDEVKMMSDHEIAAVMKDVDNSLGLIEVCKKHELPLNTVFLLRSKFRGMNEPAITRTRQLEERYAEMTQQVETLLIENKRLSSSSSLSSQQTL